MQGNGTNSLAMKFVVHFMYESQRALSKTGILIPELNQVHQDVEVGCC